MRKRKEEINLLAIRRRRRTLSYFIFAILPVAAAAAQLFSRSHASSSGFFGFALAALLLDDPLEDLTSSAAKSLSSAVAGVFAFPLRRESFVADVVVAEGV